MLAVSETSLTADIVRLSSVAFVAAYLTCIISSGHTKSVWPRAAAPLQEPMMNTARLHRTSECASCIPTPSVIVEVRSHSGQVDIQSLARIGVRGHRDVRP